MTLFVGPVDLHGRPERCQNAPGCTVALLHKLRGRPRLYCSQTCRYDAWARRERDRVHQLANA